MTRTRIRKRGPVDTRPTTKKHKPGDMTLAEAHNGRHGRDCAACRETLDKENK